jgi:rubredoxin
MSATLFKDVVDASITVDHPPPESSVEGLSLAFDYNDGGIIINYPFEEEVLAFTASVTAQNLLDSETGTTVGNPLDLEALLATGDEMEMPQIVNPRNLSYNNFFPTTFQATDPHDESLHEAHEYLSANPTAVDLLESNSECTDVFQTPYESLETILGDPDDMFRVGCHCGISVFDDIKNLVKCPVCEFSQHKHCIDDDEEHVDDSYRCRLCTVDHNTTMRMLGNTSRKTGRSKDSTTTRASIPDESSETRSQDSTPLSRSEGASKSNPIALDHAAPPPTDGQRKKIATTSKRNVLKGPFQSGITNADRPKPVRRLVSVASVESSKIGKPNTISKIIHTSDPVKKTAQIKRKAPSANVMGHKEKKQRSVGQFSPQTSPEPTASRGKRKSSEDVQEDRAESKRRKESLQMLLEKKGKRRDPRPEGKLQRLKAQSGYGINANKPILVEDNEAPGNQKDTSTRKSKVVRLRARISEIPPGSFGALILESIEDGDNGGSSLASPTAPTMQSRILRSQSRANSASRDPYPLPHNEKRVLRIRSRARSAPRFTPLADVSEEPILRNRSQVGSTGRNEKSVLTSDRPVKKKFASALSKFDGSRPTAEAAAEAWDKGTKNETMCDACTKSGFSMGKSENLPFTRCLSAHGLYNNQCSSCLYRGIECSLSAALKSAPESSKGMSKKNDNLVTGKVSKRAIQNAPILIPKGTGTYAYARSEEHFRASPESEVEVTDLEQPRSSRGTLGCTCPSWFPINVWNILSVSERKESYNIRFRSRRNGR